MPQIAEPITSLERELELRIEWLEKGLKEILDCCDLKNMFMLSSDDTAFAGDVKDIAQASLDGEPTTADEHNRHIQNSGVENLSKKDVKIDLKDKSREKKINMIQSIGYRGEE